jgi:hypothetical protein
LSFDLDDAAVEGFDGAVLRESDHALGDPRRVVQHGARLTSRDETPVFRVSAICISLGDDPQAGGARLGDDGAWARPTSASEGSTDRMASMTAAACTASTAMRL